MNTSATAPTQTVRNAFKNGVGYTLITALSFSTPSPQPALPQRHFYSSGPSFRMLPTEQQAESLAPWLRKLKEQSGLTLAGLASMIGVSRPTLYGWGRGAPQRERNAERLAAFRAAIAALVAAAPGGRLPALWHHQKLPSFGRSFAQGMRAGDDPTAMARDLAAIWQQDAKESAAIAAFFKSRA